MKKRIEGLDIAKGICIILVIIGHTLGKQFPEITKYGVPLRMPFFFIISGFFFKQYSDKYLLERNSRRLLLPYLATVGIIILRAASKIRNTTVIPDFLINSTTQLLYGAVLTVPEHKTIFGLEAAPVGPVWFLICLFCATYLFHWVIKLSLYIARLLMILLAVVLVVIINRFVYIPLNIDTAVIALPLLMVGYYFKEINILPKIIISSFDPKAIAILIAAILTYCVSNFYNVAGIGSHVYDTLLLIYLGGIAGFICLLNLSEFLVSFKSVNRFFSFYGKETLVILCIHSLDLFIHYPKFFEKHIYLFLFWRVAVVTAGLYIIKAVPFLKKIFYNLESVQPKVL